MCGEKRFEFRRNIFKRNVDIISIYITAPVCRVVAEFDVLSIISAPLPRLWKSTKKHAGIDEDSFYRYFKGRDCGHAIVIGNVREYKEPFCPIKRLGIKPPQSFVYMDAV